MSNNQTPSLTTQIQRSSKELILDFSTEKTDGIVRNDFFTVCFPEAQSIVRLSEGMWNSNSFYLLQSFYDYPFIASVGASAVPENISPNEDIQLIYKNLLNTSKDQGKTSEGHNLINVELIETKIGTTIWCDYINVLSSYQNIPNPLIFPSTYQSGDPLKSISCSVIFEIPQNKYRLELSVFYQLPQDLIKEEWQESIWNQFKNLIKNDLLKLFFEMTCAQSFGKTN